MVNRIPNNGKISDAIDDGSFPGMGYPSTTGARSWACRSALRAMAARSGAPPLPGRLRASAPLGLPSFTPRFLATLSASLVRLEVASRSCCATSAMMLDGEVIRLGQVDRGELHAAVPQRQQEGSVPRQPVELGDHQRRPGDLGQMQRLLQLRTVGIAAAETMRKGRDSRASIRPCALRLGASRGRGGSGRWAAICRCNSFNWTNMQSVLMSCIAYLLCAMRGA